MKIISNSKQLTLLLLIIMAMWPLNSSYGTLPKTSYPYNFDIHPVEYPKDIGVVKMILKLSQNLEWCQKVDISVTTVNGLSYEGELNWSVTVDTLNTYMKVFNVTISDNDTCGLILRMSCADFSYNVSSFFVTTTDSIEYFIGDPRGWIPPGNDIRTGPRQGYIIPGEHPYMDSVYGLWDNVHSFPYQDYDTTSKIIPDVKILEDNSIKPESKPDKMQLLEKELLIAEPYQTIRVNRETWIRYRGESKFHKATQDELSDLTMTPDSLQALPMSAELNICLDLRDSTQYKIAELILGNLKEPEVNNFYHVKTTKSKVQELIDKGIMINYLDITPHLHEKINNEVK